jgi:hypothetical protein
MTRAWRDLLAGRRWFIALAALALMVQVLVPQGFMVSGDAAAPGLVICTGHGALLGLADHGKPAKAPKSSQGATCPFSAHGATTAPPASFPVSVAPFDVATLVVPRAFAVAPGRRLAAPPPPSQAPPALPI